MAALHTNEIVLAVIVLVLLVASVSALLLREHASVDEPTTPLTLSEQARSALPGKKRGALAGMDQTGTIAERRAEAKKRRDEKKAAKRARLRSERKAS